MQVAENKSFAFLFWITFEFFRKNNCQKICTIKKNVVPLHSISRRKFLYYYIYGNIHY